MLAMASIVTISEREHRAIAARREALADAEARLAVEATRHGGQYLMFGSAATGEIHPKSDLDLLADFPRDTVSEAIRAAERICLELKLPCDVLDQAACKSTFLQFVLPQSRPIR